VTDGNNMTCKELVELVSDYLEGALPRHERRRFERHISGCPYCTVYVAQMREVVRVLGRLTENSLPPRARDELLAAFRGWREREKPDFA
jgi:anti-sigma factor RsiW